MLVAMLHILIVHLSLLNNQVKDCAAVFPLQQDKNPRQMRSVQVIHHLLVTDPIYRPDKVICYQACAEDFRDHLHHSS